MATSQPGSGHGAHDETCALIAASKVEGTSVSNANDESMGSIYDVMIDKMSGNVAYAVMSVGGFLGLGADYHPVPWNALTYDRQLGGYRIGESIERLKQAPTIPHDYDNDPGWAGRDPDWSRRVDDYYAAWLTGRPIQ